MGNYRCVAFLGLGLLFMSLAPQIEARKHSKKKAPHNEKQSPAQAEAATRLQIFLDRSNFSPGKLDGHYNEFTRRALALYRQSRGEPWHGRSWFHRTFRQSWLHPANKLGCGSSRRADQSWNAGLDPLILVLLSHARPCKQAKLARCPDSLRATLFNAQPRIAP